MKTTLKFTFLISVLLIFTSCNKDDDGSPGDNGQSAPDQNAEYITAEEGSVLTLTNLSDGEETEISGDIVYDLSGGSWSGPSYFKQLHMTTDTGTLHFRVSLPGGSNFTAKMLTKKHELIPFEFLDINSSNLSEPHPELWFQFHENIDAYATGTFELKRDTSIGEAGNFSMFGEVHAQFIGNSAGINYEVDGIFWNKDFEWF